jgi:nitrate/nitrite-specific signal transduction histidine kinase
MKLGSVTEVSESLVAEIRATIDEALVELSAPIMVNHEIFENTCKDIVEVWAGVMSVSIQISSECHSAFDEFSGTAKCVLALIRDAVANASKHGFATSTEVNVSIAGNCVMLEVRNNGKTVPVPVQPGFGFQMLEEVSLQWSLSSNDKATVITALIPLA